MHKTTRLILALLLALSLAAGGCAQATSPGAASTDVTFDAARVVRVIDGDTIEVEFADGTRDKVRFIGIDTPEDTTEVEPYGPEATAYTTGALAGRSVFLEYDVEPRDKYGRLLAYVWTDIPDEVTDETIRQHLFNARLLLDGYASLLTIPPNVAYVDYFKDYEREARDADLGLWDPALLEGTQPGPTPKSPSDAESSPKASDAIDWSQAASYVGQTVTIIGPVAGTHYAATSNGRPTFLNIGNNHPNPSRLTILIWGEDRPNFPGAPESIYAGKTVLVTGKVEMYKGSPEMEISGPGAIKVVE